MEKINSFERTDYICIYSKSLRAYLSDNFQLKSSCFIIVGFEIKIG